ncbi:NUDIX domain-containing protein [uncultured Maricaulis sp.]|uniref:NUDIX hydrolase n=1 Tax=uncultured Maricaulis sp. TaxID=174710 RepID=UPI0030DADB19
MTDENYRKDLPPMRPRLAASLILTRREGDRVDVLMGRRSSKHVFMPNKYVFPGGRVDRADSTAPLARDLDESVLGIMTRCMAASRARAAAAAAVRETAEETGLLIAREAAVTSRHTNWTPFREAGAAPDLAPLKLITRAITPPGRTRRFDTWFFTTDASALLDDRKPTPSDELEDVQWVALADARDLDLPFVTHFVLDELKRVQPPAPQHPRCMRAVRGKMVVEAL